MGIVGAVFICFSATEAFNYRQTSVMQELVGKGQSVSWKKEVKRNKYQADKCFAKVHAKSEFDANLQQ